MTHIPRLSSGQIACYPTETCWGLGGRFNDREAYQAVLHAKNSFSRPFLVLISDLSELPQVANVRFEQEQQAINAFWPGPLTLLLEPSETCPDFLVGKQGLVAVRQTPHKDAIRLIDANGPLLSTSANKEGQETAKSLEEAQVTFGESVHVYWKGKGIDVPGIVSTVARWDNNWYLYRPGAIGIEDLVGIE